MYKNDFNATLLRLLFYSRMRISEALALNWSDIDFQEKTVSINKTLSQRKNGYKIASPKTKSSTNSLLLDEETLTIMKKRLVNQRKYMLTLGVTDPTMVFCGIYKEIVTHHAIYSRLISLTEKAGIPFLGVHVTRHTHASLSLDSGATMKESKTDYVTPKFLKLWMCTVTWQKRLKNKQLKNWLSI
nr:site-specific integrase [Enterococcus faecium]